MEKGYVQVYTGNGKGKTTAALGLCLRAVGAGLQIYFGQFMKGSDYSEIRTLKTLSGVAVEQYGEGLGFFTGSDDEAHKAAAQTGLIKAKEALTSGKYDLLILDEINIAEYFGLLKTSDVLELIASKPGNTELILTGRYASKAIMDAADLVTEMAEIKHYYSSGVPSREGIEE